jgi:mRNA-degrading endonuclease toxin of MazEF toxin-antitoxin module
MERGDIYLVSLDPTRGREQQGERRVMIVSPAGFNRLTGLPVVVPITTGGNFARVAGFAVPLTGTGLATQGVVRCDQPRVLDLRERRAKRLEKAPDYIVDEVLAKLQPLFE